MLESRARQKLVDSRDLYDRDTYIALLDKLNTDIVEGKYAFTSAVSQAALRSLHGVVALLTLLLQVDQPSMVEEDVEKLLSLYTDEIATGLASMFDEKAVTNAAKKK